MALASGTRLGPYEILSMLGAGGMGEVYRARDSRLGRDVALKILPENFTADRDRVGRFQREAQVLASLNHPNIAVIHDLQQSEGMNALVLELVEGPTLAERLAQGPMAIEEALGIARQIAEALEAAHEQGIVHRDLKPANVKLRPDGAVKVLDFGLAKAVDGAASSSSLSMSPTLTSPAATQAGIILGTAAYMSPEQARGKPTDRRSDVWSFGCVLYEMLTGTRAFEGEDVSDVLASVIRGEPDWTKLPAQLPASIEKMLRRCLVKDRKERLPDAGTARLEIKDALLAPAPAPGTSLSKRPTSSKLPWAVAIVSIAAAIGIALYMQPAPTPEDTRVFRTSLLPSEGTSWTSIAPATRFALSPDGRRLAFVGSTGGRGQLWVRPMDSLVAKPLNGTDNAVVAFWSPDSHYLAFSADGKLKKIDVSGGPAINLADMDNNNGGSWGSGDVIIFRATGQPGISKVAASGGTVTPVTMPDERSGAGAHWQPYFLPDGKHFLYHATGGVGAVYLGSLDPGEQNRALIPSGSNAQYAAGYLLFMRGTTLMAQHFNLDRFQLEGEPQPLADQVQVGGDTGRTGAFSVSPTGVLVYQSGAGQSGYHLVWLEHDSKVTDTINQVGDNRAPRFSPDEKRIAVDRRSETGIDIWVIDLLRGTNTRVTFGAGSEMNPLWSADGTRIIYRADPDGKFAIYSKSSSGTGDEEIVLRPDHGLNALSDISSDGKYILFTSEHDIWFLPLFGDKKPQRLMKTPFDETTPQFSPDRKWIAYESNESNPAQVYVVPFPPSPTGQRVQISINGGGFPRWRGDSKELFFGIGRELWSVDLKVSGAAIDAGPPKRLFQVPPGTNNNYAVTADGKRFITSVSAGAIAKGETPVGEPPIVAVFNWTAALKTPPQK